MLPNKLETKTRCKKMAFYFEHTMNAVNKDRKLYLQMATVLIMKSPNRMINWF